MADFYLFWMPVQLILSLCSGQCPLMKHKAIVFSFCTELFFIASISSDMLRIKTQRI